MKNLLIATTLILASTGCMASYEDPTVAAASPDVTGADGSTDGSTDCPAISCDSTPACRLSNTGSMTSKGLPILHDKLLDVDCAFFDTTDFGSRCLPLNTDNGQQDDAHLGDKHFPGARYGTWYADDTCTTVIFGVDNNPTHLFGFSPNLHSGHEGEVDGAYNLVEPASDTIKNLNTYGKPNNLWPTYTFDALQQKCGFRNGKFDPNDTNGPALMVANGTASITQCPLMTGLSLFAKNN